MGDTIDVTCLVCGHVGATYRGDGYFSCDQCNSQAEDVMETAFDDEGRGIYTGKDLHRHPASIKVEPLSQIKSDSQFWESLKTQDGDQNNVVNPVKAEDWEDGIGPTEPGDFGQRPFHENEEDHLRMIYVMGLQTMIQLQTKALVEEFNVSPLICGLAGTIWLKYVASSGIFEDHWANEVIQESESQKEGFREDFTPKHKHSEKQSYQRIF